MTASTGRKLIHQLIDAARGEIISGEEVRSLLDKADVYLQRASAEIDTNNSNKNHAYAVKETLSHMKVVETYSRSLER